MMLGLILDTCAGLIQITCIASDSVRNEISRMKWQKSLKYQINLYLQNNMICLVQIKLPNILLKLCGFFLAHPDVYFAIYCRTYIVIIGG